MIDSDCAIGYEQLFRKKSRYRKQEYYRGKYTTKNLKQILSKFNTPRRNPKRVAATVSFKRFQSPPIITASR
jgi:hypothetical protein